MLDLVQYMQNRHRCNRSAIPDPVLEMRSLCRGVFAIATYAAMADAYARADAWAVVAAVIALWSVCTWWRVSARQQRKHPTLCPKGTYWFACYKWALVLQTALGMSVPGGRHTWLRARLAWADTTACVNRRPRHSATARCGHRLARTPRPGSLATTR